MSIQLCDSLFLKRNQEDAPLSAKTDLSWIIVILLYLITALTLELNHVMMLHSGVQQKIN